MQGTPVMVCAGLSGWLCSAEASRRVLMYMAGIWVLIKMTTFSIWQAGLLDGVWWWSGFIHSICARLIVSHACTSHVSELAID